MIIYLHKFLKTNKIHSKNKRKNLNPKNQQQIQVNQVLKPQEIVKKLLQVVNLQPIIVPKSHY